MLYFSAAAPGLASGEIAELVRSSQAKNAELDITGLLLHRSGYFLQLIEGPDTAVEALMGRIAADPRHTDVTVVVAYPIESRQFPAWSMELGEVPDPGDPDQSSPLAQLGDAFTTPTDSYTTFLPTLRNLISWYESSETSTRR